MAIDFNDALTKVLHASDELGSDAGGVRAARRDHGPGEPPGDHAQTERRDQGSLVAFYALQSVI